MFSNKQTNALVVLVVAAQLVALPRNTVTGKNTEGIIGPFRKGTDLVKRHSVQLADVVGSKPTTTTADNDQ